MQVSRRVIPWAFVAPAVLIMAAGLLRPLMEAARASAYEWRLGDVAASTWAGAGLYIEALSDPAVRNSLLTTVWFSLLVVGVEMTLGVALALLLEKPVRGIAALRTVFVLPMMIAPICVGLIWRYLFDTNYGPINQMLRPFGLAQAWLAEPGLAFAAIVVADVWQWTPFVLIMALAGLQGLDASVSEAARVDGAGGWRLIAWIKLPLIWPILLVTLLMRMIDAVRGLEVVYVMTFGGPGRATELFSLHIYKAAFISQRLGYAAALSVILLAAVALLTLGLLRLSNPLRRAA